jgi:hypothetical protein
MRPMDERTVANMRSRVAQCRRLANTVTDARAAAILRQMAEEGDADLARILAEGADGKPKPDR